MIVWGGVDGTGTTWWNDGAVYNPGTDAWESTTSTGAGVPSARWGQAAVWTGTEMIVWGGFDGASGVDTGARYDPATDAWLGATSTGAGVPAARQDPVAIWTGREMIVWGGWDGAARGDGGRYTPPINLTVGTYNASLGGPSTLEAFLAEARQQSKSNWRDEYTAQAVADYIREGFTPTGNHGAGAVDPPE